MVFLHVNKAPPTRICHTLEWMLLQPETQWQSKSKVIKTDVNATIDISLLIAYFYKSGNCKIDMQIKEPPLQNKKRRTKKHTHFYPPNVNGLPSWPISSLVPLITRFKYYNLLYVWLLIFFLLPTFISCWHTLWNREREQKKKKICTH